MKHDRKAYFNDEIGQIRYRQILEQLGDFSAPPSKMLPATVADRDYELDEFEGEDEGDMGVDDFEDAVAFFESPGGRAIVAEWERQLQFIHRRQYPLPRSQPVHVPGFKHFIGPHGGMDRGVRAGAVVYYCQT